MSHDLSNFKHVMRSLRQAQRDLTREHQEQLHQLRETQISNTKTPKTKTKARRN